MTGIRRVSDLGSKGVSSILDGSIQATDLSPTISLSGMRNLIINGDMSINQRNTTITNSGYSVDRWAFQKFGSGTAVSVAQSSDAPPNFTNSLKMTTTFGAAETSAWFYQRVEGLNTACLRFGMASAKQVTVSFWVKSSLSGTYSVTLQNDEKTRVYAASYTISAANTWEYKTVTIPGDTTGSWLKTNGSGLDIYFPFGTNGFPSSAYVASTLDAWFTGAGGMAFNVGTSATPNVMATTGNIFAITGVQVEQNFQATPFEQRPIGVELALCQRYHQQLGQYRAWGWAYTTANAVFFIPHYVPMRSSPTLTIPGLLTVDEVGTTLRTFTSSAQYVTDTHMTAFLLIGSSSLVISKPYQLQSSVFLSSEL